MTLVTHMFHSLGLLRAFSIHRDTLEAFTKAASERYLPNHFHCWRHVRGLARRLFLPLCVHRTAFKRELV